MKTIKYSLYDNAISSFFIAKKNFSKFYYNFTEPLTEKMLNEYAKIGLVFLENSIELMLKAILSVDDPICIYKEPESRAITHALSLVTETRKLEDILVSNCNFKTKTYYEVVDLYVSKYNMPVKVKDILNILGDKRNAITHFGIDESDSYSELIACFINTFDVIYNYLYPMLRELNDIGHYFTDDMFYMSYLGEYEFFYNPNDNSYNNIIDFLDELLGGASSFVFELRKSNNEFNIAFFIDILHQVIEDKSFIYSLSKINTTVSFKDFFDTESPEYRLINIDYHKQYYESEDIYFLWSYSIYYDYSYFSEETTGLLFIIDHKKNKIYYYDGSINYFPEYDKPEKGIDVNNDIANDKCKELNLSKRNLRTVILEQIIKLKEELELMEDIENGQT